MANIDFSPSVFDSGKPESPDTSERSPSNWRLRFTFLGSLLVILAGLVYIMMMMTRPSRSQSESGRLSMPYPSSEVPLRIPATAQTQTPSRGLEYCTGNEVICTVAMASKPTDLLRKLVASIPAATAKQYRVRLSVTSIEEPPAENTADSPTP